MYLLLRTFAIWCMLDLRIRETGSQVDVGQMVFCEGSHKKIFGSTVVQWVERLSFEVRSWDIRQARRPEAEQIITSSGPVAEFKHDTRHTTLHDDDEAMIEHRAQQLVFHQRLLHIDFFGSLNPVFERKIVFYRYYHVEVIRSLVGYEDHQRKNFPLNNHWTSSVCTVASFFFSLLCYPPSWRRRNYCGSLGSARRNP